MDVGDFLSNVLLRALQKAFNFFFGDFLNAVLEAVKYVLSYEIPKIYKNPVYLQILVVFAIFVMFYIVYYAWRNLVNRDITRATVLGAARKRGLGIFLMSVGLEAMIYASIFVAMFTKIILRLVGINDILTMFPLSMYPMIIAFSAVFGFFQLMVLGTYIFMVAASAVIMRILGFVLLMDPGNRLAIKLVRLGFANLLYPAALAMLLFTFKVAMLLHPAAPVILGSIFLPIFILFSVLILPAIYLFAWNWQEGNGLWDEFQLTFEHNVDWTKKKVTSLLKKSATVAAAGATGGTSSAIVAAGASLANQGGDDDTLRKRK